MIFLSSPRFDEKLVRSSRSGWTWARLGVKHRFPFDRNIVRCRMTYSHELNALNITVVVNSCLPRFIIVLSTVSHVIERQRVSSGVTSEEV